MNYLEIAHGTPLCGEITVQGSKNAVLPVMVSCLLSEGVCRIENCPRIRDAEDTLSLLAELGCRIRRRGTTVWVNTPAKAKGYEISGREAARIRSSVLFLGALLGKMKKAVIPYPGGCAIGSRPVDLHLQALARLGAKFGECADAIAQPCEPGQEVRMKGRAEAAAGKICAQAGCLYGADICLPFPSVGATENIILAAVLAKGRTVIENAAREPEIDSLCGFLNLRGARTARRADGSIVIEGVKKLSPGVWRMGGDRIVAGTVLLAAAAAGGCVRVHDFPEGELDAVLAVLRQMGAGLRHENGTLTLYAHGRPRAVEYTQTAPYPGFPTDLQAPLMAALCRAEGRSTIRETIFENRFGTADQLRLMGARIRTEGSSAVIDGVPALRGAQLCAPDLRGGAALAAAAFQAEGSTRIQGYEYIARGYEDIARDFRQLGAKIRLRDTAKNKPAKQGVRSGGA